MFALGQVCTRCVPSRSSNSRWQHSSHYYRPAVVIRFLDAHREEALIGILPVESLIRVTAYRLQMNFTSVLPDLSDTRCVINQHADHALVATACLRIGVPLWAAPYPASGRMNCTVTARLIIFRDAGHASALGYDIFAQKLTIGRFHPSFRGLPSTLGRPSENGSATFRYTIICSLLRVTGSGARRRRPKSCQISIHTHFIAPFYH